MNIVLIGYRGTGKTSVAKRLSERLQRRLIGMDELIEKKAGMTIQEIVQRHGWDKFRELESMVAKEVGKLDNCIIDTGGGVILKEDNITSLKQNGKMILLSADVETITKRIKDETQRPSLTGTKSFLDEVETVLNERREKYKKAADFTIDTSSLTIEEVGEKIINYLKQHE